MVARQKALFPCGQPQTYAAISKARMQQPYGDHLVNTWSDDGNVYMAACDHPLDNRNITVYRLGDGTPGTSSYLPNGNVPIPAVNAGNTDLWGISFQHGTDGASWKAMGLISVNGNLYLSATRFIYPGDATTVNAQIFISTNHGASWGPPPSAPGFEMTSPQFPGMLNNAPAFFQHGQNNSVAVNRSDEFVYALSNGDPWINSSFRHLGRCPIGHIGDVTTAEHWKYYKGGNGMLDSNWTADGSFASWSTSRKILNMVGTPSFAHASTQPVWYPNYKGGRYIWLANGSFNPQHIQVWESPTPWGPWEPSGVFLIHNSPNPLAEAASTVVSGQITGVGDGLSFTNTIVSSPNATVTHATAVFVATGDYTSIVAPNFPNPPIDVGQYQTHLLTLELNSGSPILVAPTAPGWVPPVGAPVISSISPSSGMVGAAVTINGSNFGSGGTVTFNGANAPTPVWTPTVINATVPGTATSGGVVVTTGGQSSSPHAFTVTLPPPSITSLSPNSGPVGTVVTITGTNFAGGGQVTFNGAPASPTSWTATSIIVDVPIVATTGNVVVTVGGVASNSQIFTVTAPPVSPSITSISPGHGAVGTSVTITGTNFGGSIGTSTVTFNGLAGTPTNWADTSITVPVPSGATTGNVIVTVGGVASNGQNFVVMGPGDPLQINYGFDATETLTSLSATFTNPLTVGSAVVVAYNTYNGVAVTSVTDSLGNNYPLQFNQDFPTVTNTVSGTANVGIAILWPVPSAGMATITVTFASVARNPMISLVEIQGPFLAIDGHVSAPTSGTVNQWSTGPIAVVHNSVAVAFGWNNRVGSDAGGESVVSIESPFGWSLFNGGHLKTPPDPSLEAHFTIGYVPSHLLDATGSAAGMVILRIS